MLDICPLPNSQTFATFPGVYHRNIPLPDAAFDVVDRTLDNAEWLWFYILHLIVYVTVTKTLKIMFLTLLVACGILLESWCERVRLFFWFHLHGSFSWASSVNQSFFLSLCNYAMLKSSCAFILYGVLPLSRGLDLFIIRWGDIKCPSINVLKLMDTLSNISFEK